MEELITTGHHELMHGYYGYGRQGGTVAMAQTAQEERPADPIVQTGEAKRDGFRFPARITNVGMAVRQDRDTLQPRCS